MDATTSTLASIPTSKPSDIPGDPRTAKDDVLETGASMLQDFKPLKSLCAHLNAFHVYADDPGRFVETNHYCAHLSRGGWYVCTRRTPLLVVTECAVTGYDFDWMFVTRR